MCNTRSTNKAGSVLLFPLGQVVTTPGAFEAMEHAAINALDLIQRHLSGDWGNVPPADAEENIYSVKNGYRILSSYAISDDQNLWIITEADRSVFTRGILIADQLITTSSFRSEPVLWVTTKLHFCADQQVSRMKVLFFTHCISLCLKAPIIPGNYCHYPKRRWMSSMIS